ERLSVRQAVDGRGQPLPGPGATAAEAGLLALAWQGEAARAQERERRVGVLAQQRGAQQRVEERVPAGGRSAVPGLVPARLGEPGQVVAAVWKRIGLRRRLGHRGPGQGARRELETGGGERRLERKVERARERERLLAAGEAAGRVGARMGGERAGGVAD